MDGFVASRPRLGLPRRSLRAATDERLVAQIRGRDIAAARNAFEALYDRHHSGILAFCRHMLGSAEEAEDAVQHTFSAAYRALVRDERDISLRAWIYAIARNRCLSVLSARRDQVALDDVAGLLPSTTGLALAVEQRSDLRDLLADLQRLPEEQRAALVLAELEAHSHAEIAEILGVPAAKVKALVFQARETLMIRRQARETDCTDVREQLSILRGGALRRRELRRHVEQCEGCRVFEAEVRRQRASMALLLPVAPTLALKNSSLAAAFTATGTGAAGVGAVAGGGGVAAGGLALGVKAISTKVLATIAVAGSAGGGGYVAVNEVAPRERKPVAAKAVPAPSAAPRLVRATPAATAAISSGAAVKSSEAKAATPASTNRAEKERAPGSGPGGGRGPAGIAGAPDPDGSKGGRGRGRGGDDADKRTRQRAGEGDGSGKRARPRGRDGDDPDKLLRGRGADDQDRGSGTDRGGRDKSSGSAGKRPASAAKPDGRARDERERWRAKAGELPVVTPAEQLPDLIDDPKSGGSADRDGLAGRDSSGSGSAGQVH